MSLIAEIKALYGSQDRPFLVSNRQSLTPTQVLEADAKVAEVIKPGDVVALIGDFDAESIRRMLTIVDTGCIYVPLSAETRPMHEYFFDAAKVDVVIEGDRIERRKAAWDDHPMIEQLRSIGHPGLVLFSSGTTGMPKAILHDFELFLRRFRTPRPTLKTLNFLLFDHIGGVNTLFHTLYNKGTVVFPRDRKPDAVVADIETFDIELLPTTPTFLRLMLLSGLLDEHELPSLKVVTYGTERMDEPSLKRLCEALPAVDFRQTYGMSELGILRVKSVARDSLWMQVGGEGVETKVVDGVLKIRSKNRMLGYLNAPSPFDGEGWYDTKDLVEVDGDGALRIVGRTTEWINVGGEKVLPEVIEKAALEHTDILHAQAKGVPNPITGQHIELLVQPRAGTTVDRAAVKAWLKDRLPASFQPQRIKIGEVTVSHRFKKL
jgi:acyl-coenzyme A synthetase/AMP-(fatty) acid ligase